MGATVAATIAPMGRSNGYNPAPLRTQSHAHLRLRLQGM